VKHGRSVVIPAAEVLAAMGFGFGAGGPLRNGQPSDGGGGGGGAGGYVYSRPVAAVVLMPDGVGLQGIVDITKIALAVFTALGFVVTMVARMRRPPRA
jgi:uncharacterized spore protein YtfJ